MFSRLVEKDLDLGLKMSLGTDTTCSYLNSVILGGAKVLKNNILFLQRQKSHLQPVPAALPTTHCFTQLFWLQDFCTARASRQCLTLFFRLFPALFSTSEDCIYHVQLLDFAVWLPHATELQHFVQKIS